MQGLVQILGDVAGRALGEVVRVIALAVLGRLRDADHSKLVVMDDKDIAGADLNVCSGECALYQDLIAGYRLNPNHEVLEEPSDLLLILNTPLHMSTTWREISRCCYCSSDSSTA